MRSPATVKRTKRAAPAIAEMMPTTKHEDRGSIHRVARAARERAVDEDADRLREDEVRAARDREAHDAEREASPLRPRERDHPPEELSRARG